MSIRKMVERDGNRKHYPKPKDHVTISYKSWFHDPTKVENKFRGKQVGQPMNGFTIQLGKGVLLAACEAEILKMSEGEKAFLILPSAIAYGPQGIPNLIPPHSDIVILVELLSIMES